MTFRVAFNPADPNRPVYADVRCSRATCGKPLPAQRGLTSQHWLQYDNNLVISFQGGYGMFTDPMDDLPGADTRVLNPETTKVLCHECAHEFADWMGIDVSGWHTHVPLEHGGNQHADHHA